MDSLQAAYRGAAPASIDPLLSLLDPVEEEVVRLRYGFARIKVRTFREIGQVVGRSNQRVGQIHDKACRRIRWFVVHGGPIGSPTLLEFVFAKRNEMLEKERNVREAADEKAAASERRRREKVERDDVRRAKARTKAWQRKLDKAVADRDALSIDRAALAARIAKMELRGWIARTILPRDGVLVAARAKLVDLDLRILAADASIARIQSTPPD